MNVIRKCMHLFGFILVSMFGCSGMICSQTDMPITYDNGVIHTKVIGPGHVEQDVLKSYVNNSMDQGGRSYFGVTCEESLEYNPEYYMSLSLLNKSVSFDVNLNGLGCGCNAAVYFTSMKQNIYPGDCSDGDYYCDANSVCGTACAEIDIMEANMYSFHTTLHGSLDPNGESGGYGGGAQPDAYDIYGWSGPRDFTGLMFKPDSASTCIDTTKTFTVKASFPIDASLNVLKHIEMELSQLSPPDSRCTINFKVGDSSYRYIHEVTEALEQGMTPVVSYWKGDMQWMDGVGADGLGPCLPYDEPNCISSHFSLFNLVVFDYLVSEDDHHEELPHQNRTNTTDSDDDDDDILYHHHHQPTGRVSSLAIFVVFGVLLFVLMIVLMCARPNSTGRKLVEIFRETLLWLSAPHQSFVIVKGQDVNVEMPKSRRTPKASRSEGSSIHGQVSALEESESESESSIKKQNMVTLPSPSSGQQQNKNRASGASSQRPTRPASINNSKPAVGQLPSKLSIPSSDRVEYV
jgi:hypothetical protein